MEFGFSALEPTWLERIEDTAFEEFCEELLRFEQRARHPGAQVAGTSPKYVGDSGKDLRLTTIAAPSKTRLVFSDALTEDHVGETYFSCKGGRGWEEQVGDDARTQPGPLDVLAVGGHYTILLNRKADLKKATKAFAEWATGKPAKQTTAQKAAAGATTPATPSTAEMTLMESLTTIFAKRLADERGITANDIADRVHIYDGSRLAAFLKEYRPSVSARFAKLLGIGRLPYLQSLDTWEKTFSARGFPSYVTDPSRASALSLIRLAATGPALSPAERVVWVHGPPGVGKSRLVLEALRQHPSFSLLERRILVVQSDDLGINALQDGVFEYSADAVLVVDECSPENIERLSSEFGARASSDCACLVMIGPPPRGEQRVPKLLPVAVAPLEEDACQNLVGSELGIDPKAEPDLIARILNLCEGYPWFAVLIARALREDRNALPTGATHWDACELALCARGRDSNPQQIAQWRAEVLRRARAILAVMLTNGIDVEQDAKRRDLVASAVGLPSWADLAAASDECLSRGLLRLRIGWKYKYVTPNNLARQVAIHLLKAPYHVAASIRQHCPDLMGRLHEQLRSLEMPPDIAEAVADDELSELAKEPPSVERLARSDPGGETLYFIAQHRPAQTAALLRSAVERATHAEWAANDRARLAIAGVLSDLARRRLGFDDAERALFVLASLECAGRAEYVSRGWRSLFLVNLNPTYLPFAERLARLAAHVAETDVAGKLAVVLALETSTSEHEFRFGGDPVDGQWHQPDVGEAVDARRGAWTLLFGLAGDSDEPIAAAARVAIARNLRSGVRTGAGKTVLDLASQSSPLWKPEEVLKLREAVDDASHYDAAWLNDEPTKEALFRLIEALRPGSFHDRLVDAVARFRPWRGKATLEEQTAYVTQLDESLAREGLEADVPLLRELDWLDSTAASRATQFLVSVGKLDASFRLLPELEQRVRLQKSFDTTAAYLVGVASAGRHGEVDAVLRGWRASPTLALPTLLASWRLGANDERIAWLIDDVAGRRFPLGVLSRLPLGAWAASARTEPLARLLVALLETGDTSAQVAALSATLARLDKDPASIVELAEVLARLVAGLASVPNPDTMLSYEWELACTRLREQHREATVIAAAMEALRTSERVGTADRAWTVLQPLFASHGPDIWIAMTALLERSADVSRILVEARGSGLFRHVDPQLVLTWIGTDKDRQSEVAEMCDAHEAPLNPMARALIAKFGADSPAASALDARAHSTPSAVSSLGQFAQGQAKNAEAWAADSDPEVARWGARMLEQFRRSFELYAAREEYEAKRRR